MVNQKTAVIDLQFDISKVATSVIEVNNLLGGFKKTARNIVNVVSNAFAPVVHSLKDVEGRINSVAASLSATASGLADVATATEANEGAGSIFDGLAAGYEAVIEGIGRMESMEKSSGKIYSVFADIATAPNLAGLMKSMLPKTTDVLDSVGDWTKMLGNTITQKFSEISPQIGESASKMLESVTSAFSKFGSALGGISVGKGAIIALAIVAIVALVKIIIDNWDTIVAALGTAAEWFNTNVIQPIVGFFTGAMDWISTKVQEGMAFVKNIFSGISEFMQGMFAKDWTEQFGAFGNVLNAFFANVKNIWNAVKNIFSGIISFVKNVFAGDWGAAWDSIVSIFKGIWDYLVAVVKAPINYIIGLINGLVQGVVDGINLVIAALNSISFDIPDWVPVIGGQTVDFNLTPLVAPKIPLLAKGAVLPANKPFLAMVGDQRHGTNVEAPLATIQEAVAQVMENQFSGMMAGFEASVAVQKQILQAVLGIEVGDTVIGQAANRYNRRMAIIKGGM